jgi:HTH-type transcriptional regulator / antitoxin HigA
MTTSPNFQPNWASSPSSTILSILKEKNITVEVFAKNINSDIVFVNNLLYGQITINNDLAKKLEKNLGATVNFWLKRESQYRESIQRLNSIEEKKWISQMPFKEMLKLGWIPESKDIVKSCLNFFDVQNIWAWKSKYQQLTKQTAFRTTYTFESNFLSVCCWLRKGEIECSKTEYKKFDAELFKSKLPEIRSLSKKKNPKDFIPDMIRICAEAGVGLAIIPTPKGCSASGATRFIDDRPIILLSFRYLSDDHFWFTFFHEAGHILLHNKREIFIEELGNEGLDSKEEKEANSFSSDILISEEARKKLKSINLTKNEIVKFAVDNGISSGIVIGQLQFSKRIGFHQLNAYKRRYNWSNILQISDSNQ